MEFTEVTFDGPSEGDFSHSRVKQRQLALHDISIFHYDQEASTRIRNYARDNDLNIKCN